jgi:hypothetical protein
VLLLLVFLTGTGVRTHVDSSAICVHAPFLSISRPLLPEHNVQAERDHVAKKWSADVHLQRGIYLAMEKEHVLCFRTLLKRVLQCQHELGMPQTQMRLELVTKICCSIGMSVDIDEVCFGAALAAARNRLPWVRGMTTCSGRRRACTGHHELHVVLTRA